MAALDVRYTRAVCEYYALRSTFTDPRELVTLATQCARIAQVISDRASANYTRSQYMPQYYRAVNYGQLAGYWREQSVHMAPRISRVVCPYCESPFVPCDCGTDN